jgi:hypothetical protein
VFVGVVGTGAKVDDPSGKGLAGTVEGTARKAGFIGGSDDVGRLDGFPSIGEKLKEPMGAEIDLGGLRRRFDKLSIAQGGDGCVFTLKGKGQGWGMAAEVGLDDLKAARAIEEGLGRRSRGGGGWVSRDRVSRGSVNLGRIRRGRSGREGTGGGFRGSGR